MNNRSRISIAARTQLAFRRTRRGLALRPWVPYAFLCLGMALTLLSTRFITLTERARAETAFASEAARTNAHVQERLNTYIEVVRAANALLSASSEINHAEFRAFVASLHLPDRYPGMKGIGYAQRVNEPERRSFLRLARLDGIPGLRIWPPGARAEYVTVLFLEPRRSPAESVVGLDMNTDPLLLEAMNRARDTGQPATSTRLPPDHTLAQGTDPQVLLYTPVYAVGRPVQTVAERRRALLGFVFSPFRIDEILAAVEARLPSTLVFEIHDGPASDATPLHVPAADTGAGRYTAAAMMGVGGRHWQIVTRSRSVPDSTLPSAAQATLTGGLLLSLLLFAVTRVQIGAWESADEHAAELAASEAALREGDTRLREMVELEREARTQAQAADQAKDEFLATLSHELRTPLNAVLGWLHMLRSGSVRQDRQPHALEVIERNARRQAQLVEDLLDVSRIILGKVRVDFRPVAMAHVVSRTIDSLRPGAHAKGITLHASDPIEATIQADSARLEQIVWNLVSNAIKFTPDGGDVYIETTADDTWAQLAVRDTGVGIDASFLPHLFEQFRQADSSTTRQHGGVGLGLSIARHLVELHGGTIRAYSDGVGQGAVFIVRFPRTTAVITDAAMADDDAQGGTMSSGVLHSSMTDVWTTISAPAEGSPRRDASA